MTKPQSKVKVRRGAVVRARQGTVHVWSLQRSAAGDTLIATVSKSVEQQGPSTVGPGWKRGKGVVALRHASRAVEENRKPAQPKLVQINPGTRVETEN